MRFTAILLLLVASLFYVQALTITVQRFCSTPESATFSCTGASGSRDYELDKCVEFNDVCGVPIPTIKVIQDVSAPKNFTAFVYTDSACTQSYMGLNVTSQCGLCVFVPGTNSYLSVDCPVVVDSSDSDNSSATAIIASISMLLISIIAALF